MISLLARLARDEGGQDLIEYALLTALVGLVAIAAWKAVETAIKTTYGSWDSGVNSLWTPEEPTGS
jgi:pilus assembly protein Flp/PilA